MLRVFFGHKIIICLSIHVPLRGSDVASILLSHWRVLWSHQDSTVVEVSGFKVHNRKIRACPYFFQLYLHWNKRIGNSHLNEKIHSCAKSICFNSSYESMTLHILWLLHQRTVGSSHSLAAILLFPEKHLSVS